MAYLIQPSTVLETRVRTYVAHKKKLYSSMAKKPLDLGPTPEEREKARAILEKDGRAAANSYLQGLAYEKRLAWDAENPRPNQHAILIEILEAGLKALGV